MAAANSETELAGTVRWGLSLSGIYAARSVIWGLALLALSAPALHVAPLLYAPSEPYLWLAIFGLVLGLISPNLTEEDADIMQNMLEGYQNHTGREKFIYIITIAILVMSGISFEVVVVGIGSAWLAQQFGLGLAAVAIALWYPAVDAWLGRSLGWNIASTGGLIGLVFMSVVAVLYQVRLEVPRAAAKDFRRRLIVQ